MIHQEHKCNFCRGQYEVCWDDDPVAFSSGVEDDTDHNDYDEESFPEYCPFCGTHIHCSDADHTPGYE
jgi:hypothetical protein